MNFECKRTKEMQQSILMSKIKLKIKLCSLKTSERGIEVCNVKLTAHLIIHLYANFIILIRMKYDKIDEPAIAEIREQ